MKIETEVGTGMRIFISNKEARLIISEHSDTYGNYLEVEVGHKCSFYIGEGSEIIIIRKKGKKKEEV